MRHQDLGAVPYYTPAEFEFVEQFTLRNVRGTDLEPLHTFLEIDLRPFWSTTDPRRLHLSFSGVRDLRFLEERGRPPSQLHSLEITSIQDHQWEGLSYRVIDVEEQGLSFWCSDYSIDITES